MNTHPTLPSKSLLITILLLTMIEFLHAGMLGFAANPIMGETNTTPEQFSLAAAAYAGTAILTISKQYWLVERIGWRYFVIASLSFFIAGALICATSLSFNQFLLGRIIMGLGGAAFMTTGRVLVNLIPPSPLRFIGIKYFATGLALGITLAPGLAALAVSHESWFDIFILLSILALVTMCIAFFALPQKIQPLHLRTTSHPVLVILLISGSFLIIYGLQRVQYDFFNNIGLLLIIFLASLTTITYFFIKIIHHEKPFLEFKGLRNKKYIFGVCLFTLCYLLLGANNYMLPFLMQKALNFNWETVGKFQTLGLSSTVVGWFIMLKMIPKSPQPKKFFIVGFICMILFGFQLKAITPDANLWTNILPALICNGIFLMFVMATTAMQTFQEVQHNEVVFASAQQAKNMLGQFGMALGLAIATIISQWRTAVHVEQLNFHFTKNDTTLVEALSKLSPQSLSNTSIDPSALQILSQQLIQQSYLLACIDYFVCIEVLGCIGLLFMVFQKTFK